MAKFNTTNTIKTLNHEGHVAFDLDEKTKLVTMVCTTFFNESKYYGDNSTELVALAKKLCESDPKFVSNLAIYARKEMNLRSVSHVLCAIIAHEANAKPYIQRTLQHVLVRSDDLLEILACYLNMFGKPIPNGLKKGLAQGLKQFNEYEISKYAGGNKSVKFKDILKLTHAKAENEEQNALFQRILTDDLAQAVRWESELSQNGNNKETWEKLISENKIGYMAALRNLRNMIQANPSNMNQIYEMLADKQRVLQSKQLPFRFFSAYNQIQSIASNKELDVLETAFKHSVENLHKIPGKTAIAIDVSGSMKCYTVSGRSKITAADIARIMAVLLAHLCEEYIVYTFDSRLKSVTFPSNANLIHTAQNIVVNGGATYMHLPFEEILDKNIYVDRMIVFSDNEVNGNKHTIQTYANLYREQVNENFWVHAVDLCGYGTCQFHGSKTNIISGWSEKILEYIRLCEEGFSNQVKVIENYLE